MEHLNLDPQSHSDPSKIPSAPPSPSSNQPIQRYLTSSTDSRASISSTTPSLPEEVHEIDQFTKNIFNQMHTLTPAPGKESDDVYPTLHRARFSISSSDNQEEVSKLSASSDIKTNPTDESSFTHQEYEVGEGDDRSSLTEHEPSFTRHEYDVAEGDDGGSLTEDEPSFTRHEYDVGEGDDGGSLTKDEPSTSIRQEYAIEEGDGDFEPSVLQQEDGPEFTMHEPPPPAAAPDVRPSVSVESSPQGKDSIFKNLQKLFKRSV